MKKTNSRTSVDAGKFRKLRKLLAEYTSELLDEYHVNAGAYARLEAKGDRSWAWYAAKLRKEQSEATETRIRDMLRSLDRRRRY